VQVPWAAQEPASGTVLVHRNEAAAPRPSEGVHWQSAPTTLHLLAVQSITDDHQVTCNVSKRRSNIVSCKLLGCM